MSAKADRWETIFPYDDGMKTTIDIPEPLYRKAKIRAVETGSTLRKGS
jgi:hypothetical protein